VTLKTGLGFVQGHWKWHHLIDRIRVPIHLLRRCLVSITKYSDLLVENREIFIPYLYLLPPQGMTPSEFREGVMLIKLEWLGYRTVKKLWQYVKPFSSDTGTSRTDGQTDGRKDRIPISISRVSVLTRDKNWRIIRGKDLGSSQWTDRNKISKAKRCEGNTRKS